VWTHPLTANSLRNSVLLSLTASLLTVALGAGSAYYLARSRSKALWILDTITLLPLAIPGIVFAFGYTGAFSGTFLDNRINPCPLLIAAYVVRRTPTMVRSASAGFQEVPAAFEEAALMTGASPAKVFRSIVIPLMHRHVIVGALLTFAYSMLEVSDSLLLALEERYYPVSKAMYSLMGRPDGIELASALGLIVMVIMIGCFVAAELLAHRGLKMKRSTVAAVLGSILAWGAASTTYAQPQELVVVSPHWEGVRREFEEAFIQSTGRDDISIRWLDLGGTSDIVRYIRNQFRATPNGIGIDLLFGGGTDPFLELEREGCLMPLTLPSKTMEGIPALVAGVPLYSSRKEWFAAALATFGILYNRVAVERIGLPVPSTWGDLARPEYHGLVGAGDPRKSGSMHSMYEVILQGYGWTEGWKILRGIARNVRNFSGGASQVGKEIASGEIAYGLSIDTYAGELIRQAGGTRLGYVVPRDYPSVSGDAIAVLKGAPNGLLAQQFLEFVLSNEGQMLWYGVRGSPGGPKHFDLGKLPVRPALYGAMPSSSVVPESPFAWTSDVAYDAHKGARRWGIINDLFGIFVIDVHDRLARLPIDASIPPLPLSEEEVEAMASGGTWNKDAAYRSLTLERWGDHARAQLAASGSEIGVLRWAPAALFLGLLMVSAMRRAVGRRR
jgi:ABC-type Fe3+ transport system substrate-binding protein/ABC-type spermidine/putrescine transport system permease subunit II